MKKTNWVFILSLLSAPLFAQNEPMSPAETFAARKGTIVEKRFDEIGKVGSLNMQVEYITDLTNRDKMVGVRLDIQKGDNEAGPSALLDTNEVNDVLSFITYISTNIVNRPPVDPNTEISFTSKYNLQIGCFWQKNNGWILYLRTDSQNPATETDFSQTDMGALSRTLGFCKKEIQKQ